MKKEISIRKGNVEIEFLGMSFNELKKQVKIKEVWSNRLISEYK